MMSQYCWRKLVVVFALFLFAPSVKADIESATLPGQELVIGTRNVPPFVIMNPDGTWTGISIELWRRIAAELNWDYGVHELSLENQLQGLEEGSLDIVVAALTITSEREKTMDFTHPFHTSGLGIAVQRTPQSKWMAAGKQFFSWSFLRVILVLAAVLFLAGTLVWFFERRNNPDQFGGRTAKGLGAGFWWSAVTMTTVGYGDKAPKSVGGRFVAILWMFTSIVIISGFTAAITSSLTISQLKSPVSGPEDLPKVRVATVADSTSEDYLRDRHISFRAFETPFEGLEAVAGGGFDAMIYDAPVLRYLVASQWHGSIQVLPHTFVRQYYAFGLPEASLLREPINRVLVGITGSPEWEETLQRYLGR